MFVAILWCEKRKMFGGVGEMCYFCYRWREYVRPPSREKCPKDYWLHEYKNANKMESWMANIISVFLISVIVTGVLIPQILLIAFRKKLFDVPDERKIHHGVVPRLGGFAFVPAIFLSIAFVAGLNEMFYHGSLFKALGDVALPVCFGLCALLIMYLVGMADDLVGVRYRAKFYAQILAGLLVVMSEV